MPPMPALVTARYASPRITGGEKDSYLTILPATQNLGEAKLSPRAPITLAH